MTANAGRTIATLAGLAATAPADLLVVTVALLRRRPQPPVAPVAEDSADQRRQDDQGTATGQIVPLMHGHRVVLVESAKYRFTGHRFSRAVDAFHCVPEPSEPGYAEALLAIVAAASTSTSSCRSRARPPACPTLTRGKLLDGVCDVLHGDPDTVEMLDDKASFARGRGAPRSSGSRLASGSPIRGRWPTSTSLPACSYILKRVAYNPVGRFDLTPLSAATPERNCRLASRHCRSRRTTRGSCRNSWTVRSTAPTRQCATAACGSTAAASPRPASSTTHMSTIPRSAAGSSISSPRWAAPGQLSFDFIESADGEIHAIECNPRTHSAITMFHDDPRLADAYLADGHPVITPTPWRAPDLLALPRALAAVYTVRPASGASPAAVLRGTTPSSAGGIRCRTSWFIIFRFRRCWWTTCAGAVAGHRSTSTSASWSRTVATELRRLMQAGRAPRSTTSMPTCLGCTQAGAWRHSASTYEMATAYVAPGGSWRFPATLQRVGDSGRSGVSPGEAVKHLRKAGLLGDDPADVLPAGHDVLPGAVRRAGCSVRGKFADRDGDRRRQGGDAGHRRSRRGGGAVG